MKSGKILHRITAKDGREVILRTPKWEDLDDLLDLFNSMVAEDLDVIPNWEKKTEDEEADWLKNVLVELENDRIIHIVAEVDGNIITSSSVKIRRGVMSHVGELGIIIFQGYRDVGIGTEVVKILLKESQKYGLKIIYLNVFSNNDRAIHVYEKSSFNETGRIPKGFFRKGKYIDYVIMVKEL